MVPQTFKFSPLARRVVEAQFSGGHISNDAGLLLLREIDRTIGLSTSLHRVTPVLSGVRVAAFFWIQSMVRSHEQRELLFDLDSSVQSLSMKSGSDDEDVMRLSGLYHKLIQQWADT